MPEQSSNGQLSTAPFSLPEEFLWPLERRKKVTHVNVYSDTGDIDNPEAVVAAYYSFPNAHLSYILSPRAVDLRSPPYGKAFDTLKAFMPLLSLILPMSQQKDRSLWGSVDQEYQHFNYVDQGFEEERIRLFTHTYMVLTAYRYVSLFEMNGIAFDRYDIYWDPESMKSLQLGLRHAFHVHDYASDFDKDLKEQFDKVNNLRGEHRETVVRHLIDEYIQRKFKEFKQFGLENAKDIIGNFNDLIKKNRRDGVVPFVIVAGPFEAIRKYLEHQEVLQVWYQALSTSGNNLVPNSMNNHLNMKEAEKFYDLIKKKNISAIGMPTECTKGRHGTPHDSTYALTHNELLYCFEHAPKWVEAHEAYESEAGPNAKYKPFDLVLALPLLDRYLFRVKRVRIELKTTKKPVIDEVSIFTVVEDPKGPYLLFWDEPEHQKEMKPRMMELIREVFRHDNSN